MSAVGHCADTPACGRFFGVLNLARVNQRKCGIREEARTDPLDRLEQFHNPRKRRRVIRENCNFSVISQRTVEMGRAALANGLGRRIRSEVEQSASERGDPLVD